MDFIGFAWWIPIKYINMFEFQILTHEKFSHHRLKWVIINDVLENINSSSSQNKENQLNEIFHDENNNNNRILINNAQVHTHVTLLHKCAIEIWYYEHLQYLHHFWLLSLWHSTWHSSLSNIQFFSSCWKYSAFTQNIPEQIKALKKWARKNAN